MASRSEEWMNGANISQNTAEQFQQQFANPLLYDELNLTSRSYADGVFDKMPNFNDQSATTGINDGEVQFLIHHPLPVLLNSIYFQIKIKVSDFPPEADRYTVLPICDFFNHIFGCISIYIGQNFCNIDHLDTYGDIFDYVFKRLFADDDYQNHLGRIDGMIPDTPGFYPLINNVIPQNNIGGRNRNIALFRHRIPQNTFCVAGIFRPPNLFFQKRKILPPYVPLRFILKRNPQAVFFKSSDAGVDLKVEITSLKLKYLNYNIRSEIYDNFREMYERNKTRLPDMEMPINPYDNPSAIYEYFDIRASLYTIPANTQVFLQPLRTNSNIPKAIIFCFSSYLKTDKTKNHLEFDLSNIRSYSILRDSQPIVPCSVSKLENCSNDDQDFYLRTRNTLDHLLSNETNSLRFSDFSGGAGILSENLNFANNIWVPSKQSVGQLEIKIEFTEGERGPIYMYTFFVFDQRLIINEQFNAYLTTSV